MTIFRGPLRPPVLDLTIGDLLRRASAAHPDTLALVHGAEDPDQRVRWTYAELQETVDRCTSMLLERFTPGERVGLWAPNVPQWIIAQLALANAGLVLVSMNPAFQRSEAEHALRASRASGVLVAQRHGRHELAPIAEALAHDLPELREVLHIEELGELTAKSAAHPGVAVRPDEIAQIQFTSGTTGSTKGAMLRHRCVVNNALLMAQRVGVDPETVFVRPSLLYHVGGSVASSLMNVAGGGTIIPMARWSPELAVDLIASEGGTLTGGVPTMMRALLEAAEATGRDVSSLETVILGAAPIPAQLVADLRSSLAIETVTMYGQTESGPTLTMTHRADTPSDTAETVGTALAHTELKVVDRETGSDLSAGEVGELVARSPMLMAGYFDEPERTAAVLDAEGWLRTGDLCSIDERGYVSVVGRTSDMIIRGGANVYPREIEEVLLTHPAISEVAVVGVPHERLGEDVAAFVRFTAGSDATVADLRQHTENLLARFKVPAQWYRVDEFPLTASGKVQKHVLCDELDHATAMPEAQATAPAGAYAS